MYACMYERFRLSISSLRGALTQPITHRNFEPRSSDEVDPWAGTQRLISATLYARTIGTLNSTDFTSTSVPVFSVGLYLASGIEPGTLRSRIQHSIHWATTAHFWVLVYQCFPCKIFANSFPLMNFRLKTALSWNFSVLELYPSGSDSNLSKIRKRLYLFRYGER